MFVFERNFLERFRNMEMGHEGSQKFESEAMWFIFGLTLNSYKLPFQTPIFISTADIYKWNAILGVGPKSGPFL